MLRMFGEPQTENPTPACKTCRSNFKLIFSIKFTGKIKSIFKLAMQVNFQLNFSTKFTGKIKSILKLAMLRMFCEPETVTQHFLHRVPWLN